MNGNMEEKRFPRIPETFPFDLMFKIFSNLCLQTLLNCRCVCKFWRNIIDNPSFINCYFNSCVAAQQSQLLFLEFHKNNTIRIFSVRPNFLGGLILSDSPVAKIENASHYHVRYLCYGLLYLKNSYGQGHAAFLFNPVREELLVIPPSAAHVSKTSFISVSEFCGLGFDSVSETFKLVRFYINKLSGNCTEIYVLGTQQWRRIPAVPPPCVIEKDAVSAYGDVHWKGIVGDGSGSSCSSSSSRLVIVSFDSKEEIFKLIQAPELPSSIEYTRLFCFKGCLAIAHISSCTPSEMHLDIWVLKDYHDKKESWAREHRIKIEISLTASYPYENLNDIHLVVEAWKDRLLISFESGLYYYYYPEFDYLRSARLCRFRSGDPRYQPLVFSYTSSLLSLRRYGNLMNVIDLTSF